MKVNKILSRFYVHEMNEAVEFYEKYSMRNVA